MYSLIAPYSDSIFLCFINAEFHAELNNDHIFWSYAFASEVWTCLVFWAKGKIPGDGSGQTSCLSPLPE